MSQTIVLKPYQSNAVEELSSKVSALLKNPAKNKVCVFKSPTGSGKTLITAKFIENIVNNYSELDVCFLWVSIGKGDLHLQSKRTLDRIFDGSPYCALLENDFLGSRNEIDRNEVLVVNWEKIRSKNKETGEWKNRLMQAGEKVSFIEVLENTRLKRKIILIIDESHYGSDAARTKELREIISAEVTLEMSATPKIAITMEESARGTSAFVLIEPAEVIEAGMIKREIIINENLEQIQVDDISSQELILEAAYLKRELIKKSFERLDVQINPLCLIQLPNSEHGAAKREAVEEFFRHKGISEENGKLAVWFSDEKSDQLGDIAENTNPVEFLLFKQAIDTGWDCPRAHILVKLRDIQSFIFEVQTLGRILRMPEQKHYSIDDLNTGFVFTNLESIKVAREEHNPNIIKHLSSKRKDIYKPLKLRSYYRSRIDYGDITYSFQSVLEREFNEYFDIDDSATTIDVNKNFNLFKSQILTDVKNVDESIFSNVILNSTNFDISDEQIESSNRNQVDAKLSEIDIYDSFNALIAINLQGFAPKRSIPTVRHSIYVWIKRYIGMSLVGGGALDIQKIFLHPTNNEKLSLLIAKSIDAYRPIKQEELIAKIEETYYDWDVKPFETYNQHTSVEKPFKHNVYTPAFVAIDRSSPESYFEDYLESKGAVLLWWYKNGDSKRDYLGLKYQKDNVPRIFYPDYVIQLKSGKLIIGDTKGGQTAEDSLPKALVLEKYLNLLGKERASGGIFILDKANRWRVNTTPSKNFDLSDLTQWLYLDDLIV